MRLDILPTLTSVLAGFTFAALLAAPAARAAAHNDPMVPAVKKPKVEIVFALDTTGSMGGLIESAKRKIWYIASEVQKAKQKPDLRIGLVAYRDRGDAYVTQVLGLTNDLDRVYDTLMGYRAEGGGDWPEDVNAALHAALTQMQWSEGKDTLKMIFLVGDAPPHMDYEDTIPWTKTVQAAVRRNIYVNTIQCGSDPETTATWKNIAHAAEGRFAMIRQDGGDAVAVATPFDREISRLAAELDSTYLTYGDEKTRKESESARAKVMRFVAAEPSVAADRAAVKATEAPKAERDLVDLLNTKGGGALAAVAPSAMPEPLRGKSAEERSAIVKQHADKRAKLQAQIHELQKKRDAYIAAESKKQPKKDIAFDDVMIESIRAQGAGVGLSW